MAKSRLKKRKLANKSTTPPPKFDKKFKNKNKSKSKTQLRDSDSESDPQTKLQPLLEPFSKDQLITLVTDLCLSHNSLFSIIKAAADKDISHRKIFVYGLGWDTTHNSLESVLQSFGEIEELNIVNDRATGKCKGYAFVTFRTRQSAKKLLENPKINIGNRMVSCQLASAGPNAPVPGTVTQLPSSTDYANRKIYVSNVPVNASAEQLRGFFEKFGEIESGPTGLDPTTGKFKGYAIFLYKTLEGAKRVLEEPYKVFEGQQLHCQKATEGKSKVGSGAASITTALQPVQPLMLAAAASQQAQNLALLGQQTGFVNPLYGGGLIGNANLGGLMGGYYGMMGGQLQGLGLGAYSGTGAGSGGSSGAMLPGLGLGAYSGAGAGSGGSSGAMLQGLGLGAYGGAGAGSGGSSGAMLQGLGLGAYSGAGAGGSSGAMLQGLGFGTYSGAGTGSGGSSAAMLLGLQHVYPRMQSGQTSSLAKSPRTGSGGYSANLWYDSFLVFM
ncbi:UBP1-associated protein 2B-like [Forsythia ovata]|uniref:UBP1-associated protein 2B-like n=1 Tax=Forsythia ovata TaxID=205694 RepID=A0ABD1U9C8_9LAMI